MKNILSADEKHQKRGGHIFQTGKCVINMELIKNIMLTAFTTVIVENTVFTRAMGTSTLLIAARKRKNLVGFGACVTYMTALTSILTYFADRIFNFGENGYIYIPLVYTAILGIVYVVTLLCMWKFAARLFLSMRKYIHVSAFNCAVLGSMFLISKYCTTPGDYFIHGIGIGLGVVLAVYITAVIYDRLYSEKVPYAFRGYPLLMVYIGILSMAFWGLSGHTINY